MTLIFDSKERRDELLSIADGTKHLTYGEDGESYDVEIICGDGAVYKVEIKQWTDYVASWMDGKLERQLAPVDLFIVEVDEPYALAAMELIYGGRAGEMFRNAKKHLASISSAMWTVQTTGIEETGEILKYIEKRGADIGPRANKVKHDGLPLREELLGILPRINAHRKLPEGYRLGSILSEFVDWTAFYDSLHTEKWTEIEGIGLGTVKKIKEALEA